jgi:dTDP-4-amino-4,6-dideoxygalactose transaminase
MIPLAVPNLAGRESEYLQECVRSTFVSSVGPFVQRFEQMVAEAAGARFGVATSAGTTALHAALVTVGVARDDLVVLPSLTFIASANAISHAGATPWLFEVSRVSWTLDPDLLADKLSSETERNARGEVIHRASGRRVGAIMPVHTLGIPADMDAIAATARAHGLPVVADGAAALGATYKGRAAGALGADLTMFSFNGNKTVTAGGGGAIVGDDEKLIKRFRHLTTTARVGADYDHDMVGFNYRMTNVQAAVGCAQMEQLDAFLAAKRRIAARYDAELGDLPGVTKFPHPNWAESACWFSGIVVKDRSPDWLAGMRARLRERGIDARPFWKPMHHQPPYRDAPRTDTSFSDGLWTQVVTLPCSTHLTADEQDRVIAAVRAELNHA